MDLIQYVQGEPPSLFAFAELVSRVLRPFGIARSIPRLRERSPALTRFVKKAHRAFEDLPISSVHS